MHIIQVSSAPVTQILFDKPKRSKGLPATNPTQPRSSTQPLPDISRETLLNALHGVYPSAAVFTVVPGFQQVKSITHSSEPLIPKPLMSLYDVKYCNMSKEDLRVAAQSLQLHVSEKEAEFLEKATKGQRASCLWYDHRVGQITASTIGKVVKCAERKFPTLIVNSIMQYKALNPHIPALRWEHKMKIRQK